MTSSKTAKADLFVCKISREKEQGCFYFTAFFVGHITDTSKKKKKKCLRRKTSLSPPPTRGQSTTEILSELRSANPSSALSQLTGFRWKRDNSVWEIKPFRLQ